MIETSLLAWVIASVFISSIAIMLINLYSRYNSEIPPTVYTLLGTGGPLLSLICSLLLIYTQITEHITLHYHAFVWLDLEGFVIDASLMLDPLSAAMLGFVSFVGFIIHLYAHAYMKDEAGYARFFGWFNLFMASMFLLVLAENPFMLFIGWEGVGLCSYLLISYYFEDEANVQAGNKAFILNRIGDFGFISGLALLFIYIGDTGLSLYGFDAHIHTIPAPVLNLSSFPCSLSVPWANRHRSLYISGFPMLWQDRLLYLRLSMPPRW